MRKPSARTVDLLAGKVPVVSVRDATKAMQVRSSDKVLIEIDDVVSKKKNVFSVIPSALVRVHLHDGNAAAPPLPRRASTGR